MAKKAIAIEADENSRRGLARTYRVFSYKRILEQRTAAGLKWVIRGRGVEFVDPETEEALSLTLLTAPPVVPPPSASVSPASPVVISGGPPDDRAGKPPGVTSPHLIEQNLLDRTLQTESSSSEESTVRQAVNQFVITDDEAARYLLRECRKHAPDATVGEILHFLGEKGSVMRHRRPEQVFNPLAHLMRSVANCFRPESLEEYRSNRRRELERIKTREEQYDQEMARQAEAERKHLVTMLTDPDVPESEKAWMRQLLL